MASGKTLLEAFIREVLNPKPFTFATGAPDTPFNDKNDPACYYDTDSGEIESLEDDPLQQCDDINIPITKLKNGGSAGAG